MNAQSSVLRTAYSTTSNRALGAATLLIAALASVFAAYALHSALPANAIDLPFERQMRMTEWFPEGWAFFTLPAQRAVRLPFKRLNDEWVSANAGPYARPANAFGMGRSARLQTVEMAILAEQAHPEDWTSCDQMNASCFDHALVHTVSNGTRHPTLCGEVMLVEKKPVPWAWSRLKRAVSMPGRVLRVNVQC